MGGRKDQAPRSAAVGASPQDLCSGVNHVRVDRVERKRAHPIAEIEQAPGFPAIFRDVGPSHIAGDEDQIRIVGAYGGMKLRAPAPWTQYAPGVEARRGIVGVILCLRELRRQNERRNQGQREDDWPNESSSHTWSA